MNAGAFFQLLVNQQIVALDLPVADVYEKLWKNAHPGQPMAIMYRMRGLLGDATEPFVKSLNPGVGKLQTMTISICIYNGVLLYVNIFFWFDQISVLSFFMANTANL